MKINDTHSKIITIASAMPNPSTSTRDDREWFEMTDKKKKKRDGTPLVCLIQDPSRYCESCVGVLHWSMSPSGSMCLCSRFNFPVILRDETPDDIFMVKYWILRKRAMTAGSKSQQVKPSSFNKATRANAAHENAETPINNGFVQTC